MINIENDNNVLIGNKVVKKVQCDCCYRILL